MHSNEIGRSWQQKDRIQGSLFDGAMILANLFVLGSIQMTPLEEFSNLSIGIWLGVGVLTQIIGAVLKKRPLQIRIGVLEDSRSERRDRLMGCLSFIHFIFFLVVISMSLALVGFIKLDDSGSSMEFIGVAISFAAAAIVSGSVWLAVRNPVNQNGKDIWWQYQEVVANVLLWISAAILTRFFWTALFLESEPPTYMGLSQRAFVYIGATSLLFMVFYVPARLLFLAEDYKYPQTWLRLWLVAMLPLLINVFIGSPR